MRVYAIHLYDPAEGGGRLVSTSRRRSENPSETPRVTTAEPSVGGDGKKKRNEKGSFGRGENARAAAALVPPPPMRSKTPRPTSFSTPPATIT